MGTGDLGDLRSHFRVLRPRWHETCCAGAGFIGHLAGQSSSIAESFRSDGAEAGGRRRYSIYALGTGENEIRAASHGPKSDVRKHNGPGIEIRGPGRISARLDTSDEVQDRPNAGLHLPVMGIQQIVATD